MHVGAKCNLERVYIGAEYSVADGQNLKNTHLVASGIATDTFSEAE